MMLGFALSPMAQALRRASGAVAAFDPAALFASGEQGAWYDPSDFSSMFQDAAGTIPVTAVGQVVGKINDKSGRGNHATQATTAHKPTLGQDANGKYYLAFDGVDDGMVTAAVNFTATDKMALFAGLVTTNNSGFDGIVQVGTASAGGFLAYFNGNNVVASAQGSSGVATTNTSYIPGTIGVLTAIANLGGAAPAACLYVRKNGTQLAASSVLAGAANFQNGVISIGFSVGVRLAGRIYQLIIRGALTDAAGISAAEAFVNTKIAA